MAARFVAVSESEIDQFKENAVPQKTKDATKFRVKLFKGRSFASNTIYWKLVCLFTFFCFKVLATFSNFCKIFCSTEWFQQQQKFTNEIDNMEVDELKCLAKFYISVRKTDSSYCKKTSLLSIRATLDRNLRAPKFFKNMSRLCYFLELSST